MLVAKFLQKNRLDILGPPNTETRETEIRIQAIVIREFERFIQEQTFTQKKLKAFEIDLKRKIDEILKCNGNIKRIEEKPAQPKTSRQTDNYRLLDQ